MREDGRGPRARHTAGLVLGLFMQLLRGGTGGRRGGGGLVGWGVPPMSRVSLNSAEGMERGSFRCDVELSLQAPRLSWVQGDGEKEGKH